MLLNLAGRRRAFGKGPVGVEILAGVGFPTLDLKISSTTQRVNETLNFWGVKFAVGAIWKMRPGTSLQARYTALTSISETNDYLFDADRWEVFMMQALGKCIALRRIYRLESKRGR